METTIRIENIPEIDQLIAIAKDKSETELEELLMFFKGVSVGQILASRKFRREN